MNKQWWVITAGGILLAAAVVYVAVSKPPTPAQPEATTPPAATPAPQPAKQKGEYLPYSDAAFAATQNTALLFFHASWCPQCRALEQSILSQGVPDGITIFKVNYDTATALRQKYGVTIQTTVVQVNSHGELVSKFVAYHDPSLSATLKGLGL